METPVLVTTTKVLVKAPGTLEKTSLTKGGKNSRCSDKNFGSFSKTPGIPVKLPVVPVKTAVITVKLPVIPVKNSGSSG